MRLAFINANNERFNIAMPDYILTNWSEFGEPNIENQLKRSPYQKGATLIDTRFEPRRPTIEFVVRGENRQQIFDRRLNIIRRFNPELGLGKLEWVQEDGTTYWLDCIIEDIVFVDGREGQGRYHQKVIIPLIAPNPFWYKPELNERYFIGFSGGISIPFSFPWTFGTVGTEVTLVNNGNTEAPVVIYMNGEVVNPQISNVTTGKIIKINTTIPDGSQLVINTAFGQKSVEIDGVNAFQYVDPSSEFWGLVRGENTIKYIADSEGANAQCKLTYYEWFTGV